MKKKELDDTYLKLDYSVIPVWLSCIALLLFANQSVFLILPLSAGTTLAALYALFPGKPVLYLRYLLLFLFLFLSMYVPFLSDVGTGYTVFFLPLFLYFDTEKERYYLQLIAILVSSVFMWKSAFRPELILLCLLLSIQSLLISLRLIEKHLLAVKYRDYYHLSTEEKVALKSLYGNLIKEQNSKIENAILNERSRLSRDIHDSLGHLASRGILQIGAMLVTEKDEKKRAALLSLKETLSQGMEEVRGSLHNFQNSSIRLKEELSKIVNDFHFCPVRFTYSSKSEFHLTFKYSILFIIKEALTNISRHSNATEAMVSFIETEQKIYLKICDNGTGASASPTGMGIYSIRKRTEELNGTAEISTEKGFRIFITIEKGNTHENFTD